MSDDGELAKDLGPLAALTIGIGTMIGAGIFVLPGEAADIAGPAVAASFVVGGVISLFTALSASELGTAMPKAGGAYFYINHSLGPLFGSIAGLGNWVGLAFASAFYMLGFGGYVDTFLPIPTIDLVLVTLSADQVGGLVAGALFVVVNYVGAKETGRLQNVIVVTLLGILTAFSILGFLNADLSTLTPLAPNGPEAIMPATALIFVSYLGFVQITTVGEEIKNPGRNLPLAVVGSVVIVTTLYAIIMLMLMGVVNWDQLVPSVTETPVIDVAEIAFGTVGIAAVGVFLITLGGLLATASSANASILASSRINFAMGRDKLVTPWLNEIHPRFATPYRSIAVTGGMVLALIFVGNVAVLAKAGSVLHLVVYGLLNVGLIVMREADVEEYQPSFRVPLYPVVPILGAITSFALIAFMDLEVIALAVGFVFAGVVWYFAYAASRTEKQGILGEYILDREEHVPQPAVSAAAAVQPDGGDYRVMVPLANPEHETDLITLAAAFAKQRGGTVDAVHVVTVPDQTSLRHGADHVDELDAEAHELLDRAREDAETFGVPVETHTIVSHRSFEEVFDAARQHEADLTVMGWGPHSHDGRAEGTIDEITLDLPCDFLVLRDRGFDPSRILVPTAGGPDSDLSATVAGLLQTEYDSEVSLLYVRDDDETHEEGEQFLEAWAADHGLDEANRIVDDGGDVEAAIEREAADHSMLILGATERGLLPRLISDSVVMDVVDDVDCSVLLAEKARERSLRERLFGSR